MLFLKKEKKHYDPQKTYSYLFCRQCYLKNSLFIHWIMCQLIQPIREQWGPVVSKPDLKSDGVTFPYSESPLLIPAVKLSAFFFFRWWFSFSPSHLYKHFALSVLKSNMIIQLLTQTQCETKTRARTPIPAPLETKLEIKPLKLKLKRKVPY